MADNTSTALPPRQGHLSPDDLVISAMEFFNVPCSQWTDDQRLALTEYHETVPQIVRELNEDVDRCLSRVGLEPLVKLFDRIFFRGQLFDVRCMGATPEDLHDCYGCTETREGQVYIYINSQHGQEDGDSSAAISVISTVLHECVHAYFTKAACKGSEDTDSCECKQAWREDIGKGGHGESWQRLAAVVERKACEVLGMQVRLGREKAVQAHYDTTGDEFGREVIKFCFGEKAKLAVDDSSGTVEIVYSE
ncbi:hypothetical protein LTR85_003562 [Meristemomyces frigidus]|nr:hypothetical protein LTR85_003562 [Meristemomyces frigidus]